MIRVDWLGKIGYGDICSPIAYAHNLSDKINDHVELVFHWPHSKGTKTYPNDPETIDERADFIFGLMRSANVSLMHVYESDHVFDESDPHTNYKFQYDPHNHWWSTKMHRQITNQIVVCPPTENTIPFSHNKSWKDPLGSKWNLIIDQFDAKVVSYRTPMSDLVNMLLGCRAFIGYHGSCAWVARHLRVPSILFSGNTITNKMFPSEVCRSLQTLSDLDCLIKSSRQLIAEYDNRLTNYTFSDKTLSGIVRC